MPEVGSGLQYFLNVFPDQNAVFRINLDENDFRCASARGFEAKRAAPGENIGDGKICEIRNAVEKRLPRSSGCGSDTVPVRDEDFYT